jgi:hypothetical protein
MRFRLRAFALHLAGSACALTLVLGGLYLGWYRWPGWYLTSVLRVLIIVGIVDLGLGPTLTLVIANPAKRRRTLARDIAVIVIVQIAALGYGATTLWQGRPLYYTFSLDRLEMVQANDLKSAEIALGQKSNPRLAPHFYSLPRWVWAPLPDDPAEAAKIVNSQVFGGGQDVIYMPRYFKPCEEGLPKLRQRLTRLDDIGYVSKAEKLALRQRMIRRGFNPDQSNTLLLWGGSRRVLAVFDSTTLRIQGLLKAD